ncbi:MAG: sulfotransferase [Cyclobacteriaceae bacterium]|nr:sulfotransferase [Cyclobacteriaceae bacterium]
MIAQLDKDYIKIKPAKAIERLLSYSLFEGRPVTTSGRWINPLVFSLISMEKKLPRLQKVEKPIFILGTGRSGTTLLGILLSIHKELAYLNEPKAIWHSIFPFEDLVGNYSDNGAKYRLDKSDATEQMIVEFEKIYGFYLWFTNRHRVVDKYPELIFRTEFVKAIFPDAKFIILARNGYNTASSIQTWSKTKSKNNGTEKEDWWGKNNKKWDILLDEVLKADDELGQYHQYFAGITSQRDKGMVEWYLSMKEGLKISKSDHNAMLIKYEDLLLEPELTLNKIFDHTEIAKDNKVLKYAKTIIRPNATVREFEVDPKLKKPFLHLMAELGYCT